MGDRGGGLKVSLKIIYRSEQTLSQWFEEQANYISITTLQSGS